MICIIILYTWHGMIWKYVSFYDSTLYDIAVWYKVVLYLFFRHRVVYDKCIIVFDMILIWYSIIWYLMMYCATGNAIVCPADILHAVIWPSCDMLWYNAIPVKIICAIIRFDIMWYDLMIHDIIWLYLTWYMV